MCFISIFDICYFTLVAKPDDMPSGDTVFTCEFNAFRYRKASKQRDENFNVD